MTRPPSEAVDLRSPVHAGGLLLGDIICHRIRRTAHSAIAGTEPAPSHSHMGGAVVAGIAEQRPLIARYAWSGLRAGQNRTTIEMLKLKMPVAIAISN